MKALILNSGLGHRMGVLTSEHPKCMTEISAKETILSRQLRLLSESGIKDIVITTGYYDSVLVNYCKELDYPVNITFIKNSKYSETNYIYSIYCAKASGDSYMENYCSSSLTLNFSKISFTVDSCSSLNLRQPSQINPASSSFSISCAILGVIAELISIFNVFILINY